MTVKGCGAFLFKETEMPKDKGYPKGRVQSSVVVVNPMPKSKISAKRKGIRK